jgi:hypothetical protein
MAKWSIADPAVRSQSVEIRCQLVVSVAQLGAFG